MGKPTDGTHAGDIVWDTQIPIFPKLQTPKYVMVNISGLQPNPDYDGPVYPIAYNGNSYPIRIDCTGWHKFRPGMGITWSVNPDISFLLYKPIDEELYPLPAFMSEVSNRPIFGGPNTITKAMNYPYYGGQFHVTWISLLGPHSIWSQMKAFGFDTDGKTKLEMIAQENYEGINRYARVSDHTCIKITMDKTYGQYWPYMNWQFFPAGPELDVVMYFQTTMNQTITPDPADFIFHDIEFSPTPAAVVEWITNTVLSVKAYPTVTPTALSYLEYIPGVNPLTTNTAYILSAWNQMYLPA
jgi:hypothetical protein